MGVPCHPFLLLSSSTALLSFHQLFPLSIVNRKNHPNMGGINPKGRNWGPTVNFDDLGKFYVSFTVIWTVILCTGMGWLVLNRHLSFLKIRNIPLAIAATGTLHVYLIKILLAYTANGHFPCTAEFWIMSIYLPLGIALFQANMVQLQSISVQQQRLLDGQSLFPQAEATQRRRGIRGLWIKWRAMTVVKRTEILIAVGMVVQVSSTYPVFSRCHPKFSFLRNARWLSLSPSIWHLASFMALGGQYHIQSRRGNAERVENGYPLSFGNWYGAGFMAHSSFTRSGTSRTFTTGASKPPSVS